MPPRASMTLMHRSLACTALFVLLACSTAPEEEVVEIAEPSRPAAGGESQFGGVFQRGATDRDRDGVNDANDACPEVPEDRDGDQDDDGCPEGNEGDRDGDGMLDHTDMCPDDPEDRDGFQDDDGCPEPDNDHDGILDRDDLCPNDPEDRDGVEDEDGCPDP